MNRAIAITTILISSVIVNTASGQNNPSRVVTGLFEYPVGTAANQVIDSVGDRGYEIIQDFNNPRERGYCTDDPQRRNDTPEACASRSTRSRPTTWRYRHSGLDINQRGNTDCGNPIYATADGKVISTTWSSGAGNMTRIKHRTFDGVFDSLYQHQRTVTAQAGNLARRRNRIGTIGGDPNYTDPVTRRGEGSSNGCHLHFVIVTEGATDAGYYNDYPMPPTHSNPAAFIARHQYPYTAETDADNPYFCTDEPRNSDPPNYVVSCTRQTQTHAVGNETLPRFEAGQNITLNAKYIEVGKYNPTHTQAYLDVYVERDGVAFTRNCTSTINTDCLDHQPGPWSYANEPHTAHVTPIIRSAQLGADQTQAVYRFYTCIRFVGQTRTEAQCKRWPDFDVKVVLLPREGQVANGTVQLASASTRGDAGIAPVAVDAGSYTPRPSQSPGGANSLAQGQWAYSTVSIDSTAIERLIVSITNLSADLDLYVRLGQSPTYQQATP